MLLESKKNLSGQENSKLVILTSGHREFRQYAEYAEGGDTASASHTQKSPCAEREKYNIGRPKRVLRSPAGPRRLGTATRMGASLFRRLSAFFGSAPRPRPKRGKVRRSDTRPGEVCERAERSEGSDTTPHPKRPVFRPVSRCVRFFSESRVCTRFHPQKQTWGICGRC